MDHSDEISALREEVRRLRKALSEAGAGLSDMLHMRGFHIHSKEPDDDLLLPAPPYVDSYYEASGKYSFRLFLRDVIKHRERFAVKDVTRYATADKTNEYVQYLSDIGLVEKYGKAYRLVKRALKSYGPTLEWYVSEIFKREFHTEAFWGVKFKGQRAGGDYDVVAKADGSLLYMEVKSSPPKQIYDSEIAGFLDRVLDLNPAISIFFMDTELRMKDKIVPMFEKGLSDRFSPPPKVVRLEMELFQVDGKIFIINAKHSIKGNIEKVLAYYFRQWD